MARFYSSQGYQDGRKTKDTLGRQSLKSIDTSERETLRQRLNAFTRQARKSSSIRRFEPCYRQIYPSKKRKTTFKIPKKPPYIPAVYQKKTTSYREKYDKVNLEPVKGRRLQWPPLYPSKRKDRTLPKQSEDKSRELPSWLLPLYSCKICHNEDVASTSEARFSGGAFRRKMEIIESIKQIRANQDVLLGHLQEKETKKDESMHSSTNKSVNAVEALKRKINSMNDYLSAVKNMEAYRNKYKPRKTVGETELVEEPVPVRKAYDRIYQTKPPTLDREVRVRKTMSVTVGVPKPLAKSVPVNVTKENAKEVDNIRIHSPKKQYEESIAQNPEANSTKQMVVDRRTDGEAVNTLGQIYKESVVLIKQPSWKKHQISNSQTNNEPITGEKKTLAMNHQTNTEFSTNQIRASPKREPINDTTMMNPQSRKIKVQDSKILDSAKSADAWTVESLKSRINVMKIKNVSDEPGTTKLEGMTLTRNGGEVNPKISQVALRSFHKEAGPRNPKKFQVNNTTINLRSGYQRTVNRRNFSTFRQLTLDQSAKRASACYRRTNCNAPQNKNKKRSWVSRLKRCFVLKKIKGSKFENWKEAPREIPYASEEVKYNSPAPILWKPSELDSHFEQRSKPAEIVFREKVNPAVLNAEQRVLASISRLISTKPQSDVPGIRVLDIENKIKKAKHKVNMMPWLKRSKSTDTVQTLPQLRGSYNKLEKDEPQESGYKWILKNRDMVEELKRQSRYAAGKSLVPTEVKNSINEYRLPLKGEISRYRKKMDQKCSEPFYMYSASRRWYSTSFAGKHRRILSCSDVIMVNTRGIKTTESHKECIIPSKFLDRRTRSDIVLGPNLRRYNQGVSYKPRKSEEMNENPEEEKRPNRWAWKVPNKTRAFTPKATTLTSPCKAMGTRMSEMSPCALKKQVEALKCLIKKAREEGAEKTDDSPLHSQSGDEYEAKLKRLVRAAHNNAQKMQIVGPRYTSENNMLVNKPSSGKRNSSKQKIQCNPKSENSKTEAEVSVLKSLFRKTKGEPKTLADEILHRNNLTSLPALASKKSEKHISKVYLKLKSLVDAVRNKSVMLEHISDVKLLPSKSLKGSISVDAMLPVSKSSEEGSRKIGDSAESKNTSQVTVELSASKIPSPSNTIQLWKGEIKPKEFNFVNDKEPTYGDLLTLFTKAKGLFYYEPPEDDKIINGKSSTAELHKTSNASDKKDTVLHNEKTENWLSMREDISNAVRVVSQTKKDPNRETFRASSHLVSMQQNNPGVDNLSEYMMTKSKMIPFELLKSESKITCDHMWSSVPVKVSEDEDLCRKSNLETNLTDDNRLASHPNVESTSLPESESVCPKTVNDTTFQTKLWQPDYQIDQRESQKPVSHESTKPSFQKRIISLSSLTKNFGSGVGSLLGNVAESRKTNTEAAVSNTTTHMNHEQKAEEVSITSGEISNSIHTKMEQSHDINDQSQNTLGGNVTSNNSQVAHSIKEEVFLQSKTAAYSGDNNQSNQPEKPEQYAQDCFESLSTLEGKVKEYENYYRDYFTEDVVSGYENLHHVYDGLINLNKVGQDESPENLKVDMATEKEASSQFLSSMDASCSPGQTTKEGTKTPIEMVSRIVEDSNTDGSAEIQLKSQAEAMKTKQDGITTPLLTSGTQGSSLSRGVSETGRNYDRHSNGWQHETDMAANSIVHEGRESEPQRSNREFNPGGDCPFKSIDVKNSTETFIDASGNIREGIQFQESSPVQNEATNFESYSMPESKGIQLQFSDMDKKEEPANFEDLLSQDPTLNPEVVKNLKLPVILQEDCHKEKNWYTKFFSGTHQNH